MFSTGNVSARTHACAYLRGRHHLDNLRELALQLEHGRRVTELMKQRQYAPMSVSEMGVSLFSATQGFLEDVEVDRVLAFEAALLEYMHEAHGDFMKQIDESGAYNDEIVETMRSAIARFKETRTW